MPGAQESCTRRFEPDTHGEFFDLMPQYIVHEYRCRSGHRVASLETRGDVRETRPCHCGEVGVRTISAPRLKFPYGTVSRGKSDERPPGVPDSSLLADGMSMKAWRAKYTVREKDEDLERAAKRVRNLPDSKL